MQVDLIPFERIRARALVGYAILTLIAASITISILFKNRQSPLPEALQGLLLYSFFFLFTLGMLARPGLSYKRLFGSFPAWRTLGQYSLWAMPLLIIFIAAAYLLFFPLSFLFPGFVKSWFIEFSPTMFWTSGDNYILANLLNFLTVVLIAPVLEEFFFRGILLIRWTVKWSILPAVIASSGVFALLHIDPIGKFCYGCVMAILYIRTKSLFIPISLHVINNLMAWIMEFLGTHFDDPTSHRTLTEFQESWWIGLLAIVISIPCIFQFWRCYISNIDWRIPYLSQPANSEGNANSNSP